MTKKIITRIDDNGIIREYSVDDDGLLKEEDVSDIRKLKKEKSRDFQEVLKELEEEVKVDGGGLRKNGGKLRADLIPMSSLRSLSRVLGKGAEKYDDNNWRRGMKWSTVQASLFRHLMKWIDGEDFDDESGLNHMDHVMANVAFLVEYIERYPEGDDRFKR